MKEELIEWRLDEMQKWLKSLDGKMDDLATRMTKSETASHFHAVLWGSLAGCIPALIEVLWLMNKGGK